MKKYIHYCCFGKKELTNKEKKYIKSWKKYLPDYEIIEWNKDNSDLEECLFIKEAFNKKSWDLVNEYIGTKAINKMGGILLDTNVEIVKNISKILNNEIFLGVGQNYDVESKVWYEKKQKSYLSTAILRKYKSFKEFDIKKKEEYKFSRIAENILKKNGYEPEKNDIQTLKNNIYIYPKEYFYPYEYDWEKVSFTKNTYMIYHVDSKLIPTREKAKINMVRKLGKKKTTRILSGYKKSKDFIIKIAKKEDKGKKVSATYLKHIDNVIENINKHKDSEYIVLHHGDWLGITSATKELFDNTIDCHDLHRKKDVERIGKSIIDNNIKQVIFSSFCIGDKYLASYLKSKKKSIKIKVYWHGNNSQVLDDYNWQRNIEINKLYKKKIISVIGTCKQSITDFYTKEKYKNIFITNRVTTNVKKEKTNRKKEIRIGLYTANSKEWRKNMFTQIAAVSLIKNAVIDMVPLNDEAIEFAQMLNVKIEGNEKTLSREELIKRMAQNNINLYVTFSECSPMIPLESFEVGVPCITGNNHHYFTNTKLQEYVIINNEANPSEIKEQIVSTLKNKDQILTEYKKISKNNQKESKEQVKQFIEM